MPNQVVGLPYQKAVIEGKKIMGTIAILDVQYGNVWTNIGDDLFRQLDPQRGDTRWVVIYHNKKKEYDGRVHHGETFGAVANGKPLMYLSSLLQVSVALNQGSLAEVHKTVERQ